MTDRKQFEVWFNKRWPEFTNSTESAYEAWCAGAAVEKGAWNDAICDALQSDLENGVKWLNENASADFKLRYPALSAVIRARGEET